ncbi:MAG TPA: helix-turn-helix domain-containing protein [Myxococcaceae bacterium]|nr:helix-turn-helix domain-containing protein [Myxococcaceae bacterium]
MEWVNAKDGIPRDMKTAGIADVALSSGRTWAGFAVEAVTYLPQELPPGYAPGHWLGAFELDAPVKMEHRFPDERWHTSTLVRGGLFLYPAFADFTKVWKEPLPAVTMQIEPASIPGIIGQDLEPQALELRFGHYQHDPLLVEMLQALKRDVAEGLPRGRLYGETLATALIAHLFRNYGQKTLVAPPVRGGLAQRHLARVRDYIHEGLSRALSLAELAALTGLSQYHFARAFRQSLGVSPYRYILHRRIGRACALLRATQSAIVEIAADCGFSSQSSFTTAFHRIKGCTPAAYRRNVSARAGRRLELHPGLGATAP